jgi:hypothetical protein
MWASRQGRKARRMLRTGYIPVSRTTDISKPVAFAEYRIALEHATRSSPRFVS